MTAGTKYECCGYYKKTKAGIPFHNIIKMNTDSHRHFSFNYRDLLIDEIALNGLDGIGLETLWKYVEKRISSSLTDKMKKRFWDCIVNSCCVTFYLLPEPVPCIDIKDRFFIIDETTGQLLEPSEYLDGPYEYHPVENEYGSCANYWVRTLLDKYSLISMKYEEVVEKYGSQLIMVASLEERWHSLAAQMPFSCLNQLTTYHYCILELVGKGRGNGQMTVGKTNLTKIIKESKLLFYNRKHLQRLDLIRVQCVTQIIQGRGTKSLLLRLKRFHQKIIFSMPKVGKLHNLTQYLLSKPDYSERCDIIMREGLLSQSECKKLKKTINIFYFHDKELVDKRATSNKDKKKLEKAGYQKRRYISLIASDQESSQSDDETNEVPLECQYKVGVNLLRQAYELILEAGLKGLTQVELAQLLGIEFYTSRTVCRVFKAKNIVREFLEDKGKQRTARFIAVAATADIDTKYEAEKTKLLQHFKKAKETVSNAEEDDYNKEDVPKKKMKLEDTEDKNKSAEDIEQDILEVKVLDGLQNINNESLLNPKKSLSMRQLRFANGLLKVIKEKQAVSGYQTLSTLVSEKNGEPPMDTKALKKYVQKLITDGQLKILKLKWPGFNQKYSILICAPNVKSTSSIVRAKYKDICAKSVVSRKTKTSEQIYNSSIRHLSQLAYPRYMKIQKLHELISQLVWFNPVTTESHCIAPGVTSLLNIMPEMTIEFALGNISNVGSSDISHLKVSDDLLKVKLRDAPSDLYRTIIESKSLQNSIRDGLKISASLGLIQFLSSLDQVQNTKANVFYVNKNAKIYDTTGTWPRKDVDLTAIEKKYHFETFDDVTNYWKDVYTISVNTDILLEKRERYLTSAPIRKQSEVETYDVGLIHGDGNGPCGFHSSVFMDIPRLWNTLYLRNSKTVKSKAVWKNVLMKTKKMRKFRKPKIPKNKKALPLRVSESQPVEKVTRNRYGDLQVKWTACDDDILLICKVAITVMSPNAQAGYLKIKNTVARTILSSKDRKKTSRICHQRSTVLESDPGYVHKKECLLNELRRHRHLIQKYEDILRKLKIRHCANISKYIHEGRLLMLELVWIILQVLKKDIQTHSVPCIAEDYDDFHRKYNITSSSSNKFNNLYRSPPDSDPEFATLKEAIIQTIILSYERDLSPKVAKKIYAIFEVYSEETLRSAIDHLRKSGAVAAKEKIMNSHMNRIQFNDIVHSAFKISANYRRKWLSRLNSDFAESVVDILETELSQSGLKGSPGINCVLFEMQSCDVLDIISVVVPVIAGSSGSLIQEEQLNVLDIEMKFKLKSGVAGWKNKKNVKIFSEIYENWTFEEHLALLQSDAVIDNKEVQKLDLQDPIVSYLNVQQEKGSTFQELQERLGWDAQFLKSKLLDLNTQKIVQLVGYFENRIVLTKYAKPWLFTINQNQNTLVIPRPWLMLDLDLRHDIFLNWSGVIMNKVFECPGCSIMYLSEHTEYLSTRGIQDICVFLKKFECVVLKTVENRVVDLFSDDDYAPEVSDFNQFESPENTLVFPTKNCLTKYCYLRKKIIDIAEADV